jgi:hypothetical protein
VSELEHELCRCGHAVKDHDAGECWAHGDNVSDERQCPCSWLEVVPQ